MVKIRENPIRIEDLRGLPVYPYFWEHPNKSKVNKAYYTPSKTNGKKTQELVRFFSFA